MARMMPVVSSGRRGDYCETVETSFYLDMDGFPEEECPIEEDQGNRFSR